MCCCRLSSAEGGVGAGGVAGDGECLRDEIIYLAHKAVDPKAYPARQGVLREGRRQQENVEKFQTPTKASYSTSQSCPVHLLTNLDAGPPTGFRRLAQPSILLYSPQ